MTAGTPRERAARSSTAASKARTGRATRPPADVAEVVRRLRRSIGPLRVPQGDEPLAELVLTILSQHTSDLNAGRAFASLRATYPDWGAVAGAPEAALADAIRSGGLANIKSRRIQAVLREVLERRGDLDLSFLADLSDDEVFAFFTTLPGVGPKTAAVVMAFSLGRDTIPVDTHVHRVSKRLGLVPDRSSAVRAQALLEESVPQRLKTPLHVGLIEHGRRVCKAQRPLCSECVLADICPTAPSAPSARSTTAAPSGSTRRGHQMSPTVKPSGKGSVGSRR